MNYIDLFLRVISPSIEQTRWWSLLLKRLPLNDSDGVKQWGHRPHFELSDRWAAGDSGFQLEPQAISQKGLPEITSSMEPQVTIAFG